MKIATWNVNMGAAIPWYDNKTISKETTDSIMNMNADVFIITEIAIASGWDYLEARMKEKEYVWFSSFVLGSNGILILVKKNLIDSPKELAENLWWKEETLHNYGNIGLLRVSFKMRNNKTCTICGLRMPIGNTKCKALKKQYDKMGIILFQYVLPIAKECYLENEVTIFAGDFNHARYLVDYTGKAQINYNWQIIKSKFENIGYEMLDVDDSQKPIITKKDGKTGPASPIDHIFTKGFSKKRCEVLPDNGLSDHLILWAED
ncbi:MAG: endonuclease/exonuclease/phosphatase family protein [Ruminococcus sp.]|uniref:endonuclease/exonuclease/phosphatase family protein n=1 Tax=Ruminococcus sp. TaxID=41978 RepID=UPI0025DE67F6|nr:endonuclease/exonuclease/phosphatase family protein [Ruminococcus sp.]MBO4867877.1 endonuclease/exonuclease/phosphatase family protein [Ruminococcus sp.]